MSFRVRYFDINVASQASSPIWNAGLIQGFGITPEGPYPDNSVISFNSALNVWTVSAGGGAGDANAIQGVPIASGAGSPTNGQFLVYNSTAGEWVVQPTVAPTDGQVLAYNNTSGVWEAVPQSGGASYDANGNLIFSNQTVSVSGSDNLVLGNGAGPTTFTASNNVLLGPGAGSGEGGDANVRIGQNAGATSSTNNNIAIGTTAGEVNQGTSGFNIGSVAIGNQAGRYNQTDLSVAVGAFAGFSGQSQGTVAIGTGAGFEDQGQESIAIGSNAGFSGQNDSSIAIGNCAGCSNQGISAIAIGRNAGRTGQGARSIAIGSSAGRGNLGMNTIVIGNRTGQTSAAANAIGINASGTDLSLPQSGFYVDPIRDDTDSTTLTPVLHYDPVNREVIRRTGIQEDNNSLYFNKPLDLSGVESGVITDPTNNVLGWYEFKDGADLADSSTPINNLSYEANGTSPAQFFTNFRGKERAVRTTTTSGGTGGGGAGVSFRQDTIATSVAGLDATLSCWFLLEPTTLTDSTVSIIFYVDDSSVPAPNGGENNSVHVYLSNAVEMGRIAIRYKVSLSSIDYTAETPTAYADGQWHHLAVVFESSAFAMYIDGTDITSSLTVSDLGNPGDFRIISNTDRFSIGAYFFPASPSSTNRATIPEAVPYLSDYIVFQSALTSANIQTLFKGAELCGPLSVKGLLQTTGLQAETVGTGTLTITDGITLSDGTQADGYVLTSDANGVGGWQPRSRAFQYGWANNANGGTTIVTPSVTPYTDYVNTPVSEWTVTVTGGALQIVHDGSESRYYKLDGTFTIEDTSGAGGGGNINFIIQLVRLLPTFAFEYTTSASNTDFGFLTVHFSKLIQTEDTTHAITIASTLTSSYTLQNINLSFLEL